MWHVTNLVVVHVHCQCGPSGHEADADDRRSTRRGLHAGTHPAYEGAVRRHRGHVEGGPLAACPDEGQVLRCEGRQERVVPRLCDQREELPVGTAVQSAGGAVREGESHRAVIVRRRPSGLTYGARPSRGVGRREPGAPAPLDLPLTNAACPGPCRCWPPGSSRHGADGVRAPRPRSRPAVASHSSRRHARGRPGRLVEARQPARLHELAALVEPFRRPRRAPRGLRDDLASGGARGDLVLR